MKKLFTTLAILFVIIAITQSQPIIIDHNCSKLEPIPEWAIIQAHNNLHIAYGHTSHGSQLTTGMTSLASQDTNLVGYKGDIYCRDYYPQPGVFECIDLHDYFRGGDLGHVGDTGWAISTRDYLENDPNSSDINVIMWSWCGGASDNTVKGIQIYLDKMNELEEDYPDIDFVYMTGHRDIWNDDTLKRNNQLIRDYCNDNNKILFDFADIESYDPDGNYYEYANDNCDYYDENLNYLGNWATEWQNSHTEGVDWYNCYAAHSLPLNGNLKAYATWWMFAKLAGWNENRINLNVKTYLEGPFNGINMDTELLASGLLPLSQPFNVAPWNYMGNESVISIPPDVVDWVLMELRDTTEASLAIEESVIGRQAALLMTDGSVKSLDGSSNLQFDNLSVKYSLFVVVYHRNHLTIMSADPLVLNNEVYSIDFTDDASKTYGNPSGITEIGAGIWGMAGGDFDCNGTVDLDDKISGWNIQAGSYGYLNSDFNLNGLVNNVDKNNIWEPNLNVQ
jgi:hypothetical protein